MRTWAGVGVSALLLVVTPAASARILEPARLGRVAEPVVAMGPGGGLIAWRSGDAVRMQALRADGRLRGGMRTIGRTGELRGPPVIALDRQGRGVIAWRRPAGPRRSILCCTQVWAATVGADGRARPPQVLSRADRQADEPVVAIGGGRAVVAWSDGGAAGGIQVSRAIADGHFAPAIELAPLDRAVIVDAQVAPDGTAVVSGRSTVGLVDSLIAVRWSPGQSPGPPTLLATSESPVSDDVRSGPSGQRVLLTRGADSTTVRLGSVDGDGRTGEARIGSAYPEVGFGYAGETVIAAPATMGVDLLWARSGAAEEIQSVRVSPRPRYLYGATVRRTTAAVLGRQLIIVQRGGPTRSWPIPTRRLGTPAVALGTRGAIVATPTRRGLELLRRAAR